MGIPYFGSGKSMMPSTLAFLRAFTVLFAFFHNLTWLDEFWNEQERHHFWCADDVGE